MLDWYVMKEWLYDHIGVMLAILAGLVIVWQRTDNKGRRARLLTTLSSGMMAAAIGGEVSAWAGWPPGLTYAAVTILGPLAFEVAASLIQDPAKLLDLWNKWRKGQ